MKTRCAAAVLVAMLANAVVAQVALPTAAQAAAAPQLTTLSPSPLVADTAVYDFGEVRMGTMVTHNFQVRNTTSQDVRVAQIRTSCGCTTTRPFQDAFEPGQAQELEVSFYTGGKLGPQRRTIEVVSAAGTRPLVLQLVGTVLSPTLPLSTDN